MSIKGKLINITNHKKGAYRNKDAFEKVAKYCCRDNRDATDLVSYRSYGLDNDDSLAKQIELANQIQRVHNIDSRGGRRVYHMQYSIEEESFGQLGCNPSLAAMAFEKMGREFYKSGHQAIVATHLNKPKEESDGAFIHAHFAVNSVSYVDGKKFHQTNEEYETRNNQFDQILEKYAQRSPVTFENANCFKKTDPQYQALLEQVKKGE